MHTRVRPIAARLLFEGRPHPGTGMQPGINRLAERFSANNPDKWPPLRAASRAPRRRWPLMRPIRHKPSGGAGGKWASHVPPPVGQQPVDAETAPSTLNHHAICCSNCLSSPSEIKGGADLEPACRVPRN